MAQLLNKQSVLELAPEVKQKKTRDSTKSKEVILPIESRKKFLKFSKFNIIEKSRLNAKYFEELITIEKIKQLFHFRNFGVI